MIFAPVCDPNGDQGLILQMFDAFYYRERLENPYYYYGSTRNQKKAKMIQQKPRPLLPSQRAALEMQQRVPAFVSTQLPGERPK